MRLTLKYTIFMTLIFIGIFVSSFYVLDLKRKEKMLELSSETLMANVEAMTNVMEADILNTPHYLMMASLSPTLYETFKPDWLTKDSTGMMITGYGTSVNIYTNVVEENGRYYITLNGFFGEYSVDAKIDLEKLTDSVMKNIKRIGYFYILDENGDVVYHTLKERLGLNAKKEGLGFLIDKMLSEGSGIVDYVYKEKKIRAFFKEIEFPFESDVRIFLVNAVTMDELEAFYSDFVRFQYGIVFPITVAVVIFGSYMMALVATRNIRKQNAAVNSFVNTVLENVTNMSASATEMEKIAENNSEISQSLTEVTQNFATSAEEGRYEVDSTVRSINSFLDLLQKVNSEISKSVELIESLNDLNDRITYLSDMISVLAINASIESSKEQIDREGIAKIVEHITRISKEARETSKITKKTIDSIQKSLSQLALYSERVEKEGNTIRSAIENISKVISDFVEGINQIKFAAENLRSSSEETTAGVEDMVKTLSDLKSDMAKLRDMIEKLKV